MRNDAGINGDAQRIEQIAWMLFLKVYDSQEENWEFDIENYESIIPEELRWRNWAVDDGKGTALTGDKLLNFVNNELFPTLKGLEVDSETPINKAIVKTTFEDANQYMKDGVLLRQILNIIDGVDLGDYDESHAFGDIYESILKELQSAGSAGEYYTPRAVTDFVAEMIKPQIGESMADFACGTGGFLVSWIKQLQSKVSNTDDAEALGQSIYGIEKKQFPYMLCMTNMLLHGVDVPRVYHDNSLLKDVLDYTDKDQFDVILMNPPYGGSEKADVKSHFPADLASSETADLFMSVIMYRLKESGRAAVILPDGFLFGTDNAKIAIKKKLMSEFNLHTIVRMPGSVFSPYTSITTNILFFNRTGTTENVWFYRMDMPEGYKHFSKTKPMKGEHFDGVREWWDNRKPIEDEDTDTFKSKCYTAEEIVEGNYNLDLCGYPNKEEDILAPLDLIHLYEEERASLNAAFDVAIDSIRESLSNHKTLNPVAFTKGVLGKLARIDSTFAENMKKSILEYAMQGELVEQRPEDGTGEELYQRIKAEKTKLIKEGKIKKEKPFPVISDDEVPFDIPESWVWVRLGEVTYNWGQKKPENTFCYVDVGSIDNQHHRLSGKEAIVEAKEASSRARKIVHFGDVIFATIRPYLQNICIIDKEFSHEPIVSTAFAVMHCPDGLNNKYLYYYLLSPSFMSFANATDKAKGVAYPAIGEKDFFNGILALPPLDEQNRIVAKLDELLAMCERLSE